jgi:membrane-associated phospholipid phosphatase
VTRLLGFIGMTTILVASSAMIAGGQTVMPPPAKSAAPATSTKKPVSQNKTTSTSKRNGWEALNAGPSFSATPLNSFRAAPKNFLFDQKAMWTSPAKLRVPEATWLFPVAGFTAGLFATDSDFMRSLSHDPSTLSRYNKFSNYGLGTMAGLAGGAYFLGLATNNEHERETGFLSGEAAVDSLVAAEVIKYMAGRERPIEDNANGKFWQGGDSFPSVHSAAAWSIAGIVAHEYPSPLVKFLSYGAASAVSLSRIKAEQHFPSDVAVGSALGWLVSQYVYKEHHDPDLPGGPWELLGEKPDGPGHWRAKDMGSPYVPLDSWIYPALLRLAALGYIHTDMEGMRPWTRMECARLVEEASDQLEDEKSTTKEADQLYSSLQAEFAREINWLGGGDNRTAQVESVYSRVTGISGEPLTDGYHFGQTVIDDYGRPYEEGFNNVTGFSASASDGPFVAYVQGEYQHAPSAPALPLAARQVIGQVDALGVVPPGTDNASVDQFQLLDSYVGMTADDIEVSFGKQSLWWGPGEGGPLMFSDNAEPVDMLRINNVHPFKLPGILGWLGPVRAEFFLGRLTGQDLVFDGPSAGIIGQLGQSLSDQPFINGQKLTIKPTKNFEFSISKTTVFGGPAYPVTWRNFFRSIFARSNYPPGNPNRPGDRRIGADFDYRVPGLRHWLTFYADGLTEDEISPLAYPRKSAMQGGIYLPRIPGIEKLDFRAEGGFTEPPGFWECQGCFYFNTQYLDGYTNRGHLMGSWLGRGSEGEQLWSTYWVSGRDSIKFGYRHSNIAPDFIPGGGNLTDGSVSVNWWVHGGWNLSTLIQYERWNIPVLALAPQSNWTTSMEIGFWPKEGKQTREE